MVRSFHPIDGLLIILTSSAAVSSLSLAQIDTTGIVRDTIPSSTLRQEAKPFQPEKNAWLAVGFSAVLPGSGQIYNEDYWKVPLIWGLGGYYVYEWVRLNNRYKDFRDQFNTSVQQRPPFGDDRFLRLRDFYRDERDKFAWYLGLLYFLNLVDAYVGANLYDFDVSPDLSADGRVMPKVMATVRVRF
ncbi:MAG: hypothetical protein HY707_02375 [Ignavibacteriae bacterium]|nr:hypothetical protein [Ignavibacteriota bacterium]